MAFDNVYPASTLGGSISQINFKSALIMFAISLFPLSSFAFHSASKLPEGEIMVCKHFNQIVKGNKVEVYQLNQTKSRGTRLGIQKDEFDLPQVGTKVDLYHREFHDNGKRLSKYHDLRLGSGTIVNYDFAGKELSSRTTSNKKRSSVMDKVKVSDEEAKKLHKDCIVIRPDEQLKVDDITSVVF
jgi:hypothetical protein